MDTTTNKPAELPSSLVEFLEEINGQDSYDPKAVAVGKLDRGHYLKVPKGLAMNADGAGAIGKEATLRKLTANQYAQVYALNKGAFDDEDTRIKGAVLRAELVRAGWYSGDYEVEEVKEDPEAYATFEKDLARIRDYQEDAALLALLLPLAAEHTFRTMGHHYISSMASEYVGKYNRFFNACVTPHLASYLPADLLYHRVAHWVPLTMALQVVRSPDQASCLPNAVLIRAQAAPAGTAIVTTSQAIIDAIQAYGVLEDIQEAKICDLKQIATLSKAVKEDPGRYHTIPTAYGRAMLDDASKAELTAAKAEAQKIAPFLQGFLDSLPNTSDLTAAKALQKHADVNPLLRRRSKAFFREIGVTKASNVKELFHTTKRAEEAVAGESTVENG